MDNLIIYFFSFFSIVVLFSLLIIVFHKNLLYVVFSLMLLFLGLSALFVLLGADFLAISVIIIYIGGVLILLLFGVMFSPKNTEVNEAKPIFLQSKTQKNFISGLLSLILLFFLFYNIVKLPNPKVDDRLISTQQSTKSESIGMLLLTNNLFAFEWIGFILLVSLIGILFVANRKGSLPQ
jgi:NADH:ubiquinone oxidoreductase subunit 6 (subunit J)